jgi:glycine/D-amino acid oxidase-like deaminating enzyme
MVTLRTAAPLWLRHGSTRICRYPALTRHLTADVVIVGGGMTGSIIAWTFASHGARVALLEGQQVGRGSTAASTALLLQEPDESLGDLSNRYGRAQAIRIWELSRQGVRDLTSVLRHERIACDLAFRDTIYYTQHHSAARALGKEFRRRLAAGFTGEWLDARALLDASGIVGECAIRTRGNAQCDPYRACLGLMHAASRAGARIFEHSTVTNVDTTADGVTACTPKGSVSAPHVVVATGFATPHFKPLAGRVKMKHTYVVATEPIDGRSRPQRGPGDVMTWDVARPYHYARWTRDHRQLFGGGDVARGSEPQRRRMFAVRTGRLQRHFQRIMPALRDVAIDYRWEGLFAMTPDGLPYVGPHSRYPRHLFALGYGGNGMSLGFVAARMLWEMVQGRRSADHALFAFDRFQ